MTIKEIRVSKEAFEIELVGSKSDSHFIQSYMHSERFPEQDGTGKMKDYLLVTYDDTHLLA